MADRAKEYAVYAGLAAGAERMGLPYAWPLAITAIVLQTVRHMTDAWYGALHDQAATNPRDLGVVVGAEMAETVIRATTSPRSRKRAADVGCLGVCTRKRGAGGRKPSLCVYRM
jgi:hypothetical protein